MIDKSYTEQQWQERLTSEQFRVCREKGTEPAFSGKYEQCKKPGIYHCVCCGNALFDSATKYDSGSGWPSFWDVVSTDGIEKNIDQNHGMTRVEVTCKVCNAHLGHLFEDGPQPTGVRYCINSVCLDLRNI